MSTEATKAMSNEFAIGLREFLLGHVEREMPTTKKVIAAIPGDGSYRPDPKAKTALELAQHIVEVEIQFLHEIANGEFKMEPMFGDGMPKSVQGVVEFYEKEFPKAVERVKQMTPEQLTKLVDFYGMMKAEAVFFLSFVEKHSIHHRGALAVYLRPAGGKIPSIYGGSADEPFNG